MTETTALLRFFTSGRLLAPVEDFSYCVKHCCQTRAWQRKKTVATFVRPKTSQRTDPNMNHKFKKEVSLQQRDFSVESSKNEKVARLKFPSHKGQRPLHLFKLKSQERSLPHRACSEKISDVLPFISEAVTCLIKNQSKCSLAKLILRSSPPI